MCLETRNGKSKIAKKDIVCYKVLRIGPTWDEAKTVYETPYTCDVVTMDIISGEKDFVAQGRIGIDKEVGLFFDKYSIDYGQIHTFKTLKGAKKSFKDELERYNFTIFKCIIPKGTKYFTGRFKTLNFSTIGFKGYCSDKIKFINKEI